MLPVEVFAAGIKIFLSPKIVFDRLIVPSEEALDCLIFNWPKSDCSHAFFIL